MAQIVDDDAASRIADMPALFSVLAPRIILYAVELGDAAQHFGRDRRAVGELVELAPDMGPAEGELDLLPPPGERGIAAIAIDLQDTGEVAEVRFCPLALAIGGIDIGNHRRIIAAIWSIITGIGPQLPRLGPPAPRIQHRRRCLVGN